MQFKRVMRYDSRQKLYRLGRFLWSCGKVGDGKGFSVKFSIALSRALFQFRRDRNEWLLTLFGVRLHYRRAYGGWIV